MRPYSFWACIALLYLPLSVFADTQATASLPMIERCGWFDNPSPRNAWLITTEGEWTIGIQGSHEATGRWPTFPAKRWVKTNGSYGHGCACLKFNRDAESRQVAHILASRAVPLQQCRKEKGLKEPL
ncbi:MAG: DUF4087 domain-containing protein [Rhodocyclaceae bacterium]|nr:DUF4087 domain-containing protein [Rhodocyclaceae bacterium]